MHTSSGYPEMESCYAGVICVCSPQSSSRHFLSDPNCPELSSVEIAGPVRSNLPVGLCSGLSLVVLSFGSVEVREGDLVRRSGVHLSPPMHKFSGCLEAEKCSVVAICLCLPQTPSRDLLSGPNCPGLFSVQVVGPVRSRFLVGLRSGLSSVVLSFGLGVIRERDRIHRSGAHLSQPMHKSSGWPEREKCSVGAICVCPSSRGLLSGPRAAEPRSTVHP